MRRRTTSGERRRDRHQGRLSGRRDADPGRLRLRSFHEILTSSGVAWRRSRSSTSRRSSDARADRNPVRALDIAESRSAPKDADVTVRFNGLYYSVKSRRLPVEPQGVQHAVPALPDERFQRRASGTGDHDLEIEVRP